MDLLTKQEYQSIAAALTPPKNCYIDGTYRPSKSKKRFNTTNPATGKIIGSVPDCTPADVDHAVVRARAAFDDGRWSHLPPSERKDILIRLCKLLTRNRRELAVLESIDSGKTIFDCETVDIPETIACIKWHAEAIDKIYDQVAPSDSDHLALIVREPIGVAGLVLPWNFPLLMLAWKIAPALAAGCCVVVKPAPETSLTALRLAELAGEAGLPRGVLNIITGGAEVGEAIGRHKDIDMVSFTGSTQTGKKFLSYSAESNAKEIVLEMGGKNPSIVMDDAENLPLVAQHIVAGAFWNMGENCSAISRLFVHKSVKPALMKQIKAHLRQWHVGDPLDPKTRIGALVSPNHFKKVCSYLKAAPTPLIGGEAKNGFVAPTVIELPNTNHKLAREEIFGPILSVIEISGLDEAIKLANDTDYGLCASIFTAHIKRGLRAARALRAGTVTINSFGEGNIATPFGGYKQSGFGGRDNSLAAHDQYTQIKTIWVDLCDDTDGFID